MIGPARQLLSGSPTTVRSASNFSWRVSFGVSQHGLERSLSCLAWCVGRLWQPASFWAWRSARRHNSRRNVTETKTVEVIVVNGNALDVTLSVGISQLTVPRDSGPAAQDLWLRREQRRQPQRIRRQRQANCPGPMVGAAVGGRCCWRQVWCRSRSPRSRALTPPVATGGHRSVPWRTAAAPPQCEAFNARRRHGHRTTAVWETERETSQTKRRGPAELFTNEEGRSK